MSTAFALMEGPLCLNLVNTLVSDRPGRDLLQGPRHLASWLQAQAPFTEATIDAGRLDELLRLRAAVRSLLEADIAATEPDAGALEHINECAALVHRAPQLALAVNGLQVVEHVTGDPGDQLLADVAVSTMQALTGPSPVRACQGPGCRLLFLQTRAGRRWCSSRVCGNRVRVARHRGKDPAGEALTPPHGTERAAGIAGERARPVRRRSSASGARQ